MDPIRWVFISDKSFQPSVIQHSSSLAPFVQNKENDVLKIQPMIPTGGLLVPHSLVLLSPLWVSSHIAS